MKRIFTRCVSMLGIIAAPHQAISQEAPLYSFVTKTLDSGVANTTGAVYRFSNIYTGVDAFVKITGMSGGITLQNIDRTADGYQEAFQPEYKVSSNTNGYIDFQITFLITGTNTPLTQALVSATGLDIDGSPNGGNLLKENNTIDMGNGTYEYNTLKTELFVSESGSAFTANNTTGVLYGALVDTSAKEVMYTVTATNVSSMTYRVGANNQTGNNSTRYASLYFKKFTYEHFPLAISNLFSFAGHTDKGRVTLYWDMAMNRTCKVMLEKSSTSADFSKIEEYQLTPTHGTIQRFSYTDDQITGHTVFYRLRSINEAGKTEYSNILRFRFDSGEKSKLAIFPTVVQSSATVSIDAVEKTDGFLQVTDLSGRSVKQQQLALNKGKNSITIYGFELLMKGSYIVSVRTLTGLLSKQVIVQ